MGGTPRHARTSQRPIFLEKRPRKIVGSDLNYESVREQAIYICAAADLSRES